MTESKGAGRVAIVTGAASGIGAAICQRLAVPGARLIVHTRANRAGLKAVAEAAQGAGAEVRRVVGDMSKDKTAAALIAAAVDNFGRVDRLVSNAGFPDRTPVGKLTVAGLHHSFDAMTAGFLRLVTAALPHLDAAPSGRVVAVTGHAAHSFRLGGLRFPATAAAVAFLLSDEAGYITGQSIHVSGGLDL